MAQLSSVLLATTVNFVRNLEDPMRCVGATSRLTSVIWSPSVQNCTLIFPETPPTARQFCFRLPSLRLVGTAALENCRGARRQKLCNRVRHHGS